MTQRPVLLALVVSLLLIPFPVTAANPACGSIITGLVTLTGPLICTSRGYTMASGGTLDCNGFAITGLNVAGSAGVRIDGQTGVIVKRCVIQRFEKGIYATHMTGSVLKGNTLLSNTRYGAQVSGGEGNTLVRNEYRDNGHAGLHLSDIGGITLTRSTFDRASTNAEEGFALLNVTNVSLEDCTTTANGGAGVYAKNSHVYIARCTLLQDSLQVVSDLPTGVGLTELEID